MNLKTISTLLVLSGIAATSTFAQATDDKDDFHTITVTIPEVAILDLETSSASSAITLAAVAPTEAGNAIDFTDASNSDLWLNYSSIIGSSTEPSRNVTAALGTAVPAGVEIKVTASAATATGAGVKGTTAGEVVLSTTAQNVITGVGSCYTGTGVNNGHQLTYVMSLKTGEYGQLDFDNSGDITVTYTLSDN